jgi:hypothetical protein
MPDGGGGGEREVVADSAGARHYAKAVAMLAANPELRIAVVTERDDPGIVGVAIRGSVYGELEIDAEKYDPFALLALIEQHAHTSAQSPLR